MRDDSFLGSFWDAYLLLVVVENEAVLVRVEMYYVMSKWKTICVVFWSSVSFSKLPSPAVEVGREEGEVEEEEEEGMIVGGQIGKEAAERKSYWDWEHLVERDGG